jgi:adenylosuccinate lyase
MSVMGSRAWRVLEATARRLDLSVPAMSWHSSRDRIVEFVFILTLVTATLARLADEVRALSRFEIGELELLWNENTVSSSTMPQKCNPDNCEQVVTLARLTKGLLLPGLDSLVQDHERDFRGTRVEWVTVADASHYTLKCIELAKDVLTSFRVNAEAMKRNVLSQRELICMERVTFHLATLLGKETAMSAVRDACRNARNSGESIAQVLLRDLGTVISMDELQGLLDTETDVVNAGLIVDRVISQIDRAQA